MKLPRWLRNPCHAKAPPPHPILGRHSLARWLVPSGDNLEGGHFPLPPREKASVLPIDRRRERGPADPRRLA